MFLYNGDFGGEFSKFENWSNHAHLVLRAPTGYNIIMVGSYSAKGWLYVQQMVAG